MPNFSPKRPFKAFNVNFHDMPDITDNKIHNLRDLKYGKQRFRVLYESLSKYPFWGRILKNQKKNSFFNSWLSNVIPKLQDYWSSQDKSGNTSSNCAALCG